MEAELPLADQFAGAIERTPFTNLNAIAHQLWKAHAAGHLDDDQAQALAEQLEARRPKAGGVVKAGHTLENASAAFPRPHRQRSPDKNQSIQRRRRLARASPVPPELVDQFTQGQLAVITVVAGEIARVGACTWCLDRIAAVAGVCKTLAREAIRKARNAGLLFSTERRRRGQKSLTNIVRVLRRSWGAWLQRIGCRKIDSTTDKIHKTGRSPAVERTQEGVDGVGFARSVPKVP